jgi:hypothetical protein
VPSIAADAVHAALRAAQAERPAALSPSRLGACRRQSAYIIHAVPPSDLVDTGAADVGTLIHAGWADALRRSRHAAAIITEHRLTLVGTDGEPNGLAGTADWIAFHDDAATVTVGDLKTLKPSRFAQWSALGPPVDVWAQVETYAAAAAAASDERYSWRVEIVAWERESGAVRVFNRPADLAAGRAHADTLAALQTTLAAAPPDTAPRDGYGVGFPCGWCQWLSRCWDGSPREPLGDDDAAEHARAYLRAAADESAAKSAKMAARAALAGRDVAAPDVVARWRDVRRATVDRAAVETMLGTVPEIVTVTPTLSVRPIGRA